MKTCFFHPFLIVLLSVFTTTQTLRAQTPPQVIADSLQSILDHALNSGFTHPGVIMTVTVPGEWTWSGASGYAISGQSAGQPQATADSSMQFRVGSITKNMVAACILKLEQDGLLSINDPISDYLRPTLVNDTLQSSTTVTIRQLLNHTSGIANSADNVSCQMNVLSNLLGAHSLEEAVYCGSSQGELFPPGFAWAYSNTNYSLLAMIIEEVSGQSYESFLTQTIIQPLNLQHTEIPASAQISSAHMGCYWNLGANPWTDMTVIHPTTYTGWADVVSTTQDIIAYYTALRSGIIINSTELAVMHTIDAASYDYGMGLDFYQVYNSPYIGHYGEVGNTSGLFFGEINSSIAPNGYYISYNFNTQGSDMQTLIDVPVMNLLKNTTVSAESTIETTFTMYPNPANDYLHLSFPMGTFNQLRVVDLQGREVYQSNLDSQMSSVHLDVIAYEKGTYFVELSSGTTIHTQKLVLK